METWSLEYWLNKANVSEHAFRCEVTIKQPKKKLGITMLKDIARHVYNIPNISTMNRVQICEAIMKAWSSEPKNDIIVDSPPKVSDKDTDIFNLESLSKGLNSANHMMDALHGYKQSMFRNGSAIDMRQYHEFEKRTAQRQHKEKIETLESTIRQLRQQVSSHEQTVKRCHEDNRRMNASLQAMKNENQHIKTCFDSYMLTIPLEVQRAISTVLLETQ